MGKVLNIGIDLGSDTVKVAFAIDSDSGIVYGKFAGKSKLTQVAIPAVAYYRVGTNEWVFGDNISKQSESFVTVVKIKSLMSLIASKEDEYVWEENKNYYFYGHEFPKFYFPVRRKMLDNFDLMVKEGRTFCCADKTPHQICVDFFRYLKNLVDQRRNELNFLLKEQFDDYKIALVHPSSVGEEYVKELAEVIFLTFGYKPFKVLSSTKALTSYAVQRGAISNGDDFLVFDMGEEDISVARASIFRNQIIVDGNEGHNEPLSIGGIDIDQAIVNSVYEAIADRETIGSPSSGQDGHISESGVYSKQYLLMKDIKKAKVILSKELKEDSVFQSGVPITLSWDLCIQRRLTREEFRKSIGIESGEGVARAIVDYVLEEVQKPINENVKKIFVSGGLVETFSLLNYIKQVLAVEVPNVQVLTFDNDCSKQDEFSIKSYEDSVFAPAVGGAIVSLKNINIRTILSLSYATWAYIDGVKCLSIFAERGEVIDGGREFVNTYNVSGEGTTKEELFSTHITRSDIERNKNRRLWSYTPKNQGLIVDEEGTARRKKAMKDFALKTVSGGNYGRIYFRYNGRDCKILQGGEVDFDQGIRVDSHGNATPIIRNVSAESKRVSIAYKSDPDRAIKVYARKIEIVTKGLAGFVTVGDN